jgi:hypothetical protein
MLLRDIRNSNDLYITFIIVVAACVVDTAGLFVWKRYPRDATISKWYDKFGLVAYIMDVSSIIIGILIAQHVYPLVTRSWNLVLFALVAVAVQQAHDIVFAQLIQSAAGEAAADSNDVFAILREYVTQPHAWTILVADAIYMLLTVLIASALYAQKTWVSFHVLMITLYVTGYALYMRA